MDKIIFFKIFLTFACLPFLVYISNSIIFDSHNEQHDSIDDELLIFLLYKLNHLFYLILFFFNIYIYINVSIPGLVPIKLSSRIHLGFS